MGTAVKEFRGKAKAFNAPKSGRFRSPLDKAKGYEVIWPQVAPLFEAARMIANPSFVYAIGEADAGPIKIGVSKDPISRLRGMQTGNARRLRVEYVLVGDMHTEKLLHEMWERYAVVSARQAGKADVPPGTEWFNPEIRAELEPILRTAAAKQVEWIESSDTDLAIEDAVRLVREAHGEHDFTAHKRHETLQLGTLGIVAKRPSRI